MPARAKPSAGLDARAGERLFRQYAGLSRTGGGVTVLVSPPPGRRISSSSWTAARSPRPAPTTC